MPGIWRNNPHTSEGKYPIVLRRDGTPLSARYFVLVLKDPAAEAALIAYADAAEKAGMDPEYVKDVRALASDAGYEHARAVAEDAKKPDPDAPPHRKDDPATLAWARSLKCPGS